MRATTGLRAKFEPSLFERWQRNQAEMRLVNAATFGMSFTYSTTLAMEIDINSLVAAWSGSVRKPRCRRLQQSLSADEIAEFSAVRGTTCACPPLHHHLRRQRAGIVVRRHREPVRARRSSTRRVRPGATAATRAPVRKNPRSRTPGPPRRPPRAGRSGDGLPHRHDLVITLIEPPGESGRSCRHRRSRISSRCRCVLR